MIQSFIHNYHAILINIYRIYNINHGIINLNEKHRLALIPLLGNPEIIATQIAQRKNKISDFLSQNPSASFNSKDGYETNLLISSRRYNAGLMVLPFQTNTLNGIHTNVFYPSRVLALSRMDRLCAPQSAAVRLNFLKTVVNTLFVERVFICFSLFVFPQLFS